MYSNGGEVEEGYKPDYVLSKNNDFIILESENSTSRKGYVGGMLKAAHFLQKNTGVLVFVITPKKNTKVETIAKHLRKYFIYIKNITKLREVYLIESELYYDGNSKLQPLEILGKYFNEASFKV